ncbi:GDSL-type esterase/lipase family protein [Streptomyces sp. TS71-3]|uniref:GDSL-type esterase/lipase family protein n=1 Tax=Streptomyces sp. TS71-3 TaxID=2733862 RepID=UPI001BB34C7B|nr:GDSL-type esterase/lipase family protein [Streptomyces sp. TS71-3]
MKPAASTALLLICAVGISMPAQARPVPDQPRPAPAWVAEVPATDPHLSFDGHWGRVGSSMITPNSGSALRFRFTGHTLAGRFDTSAVTLPAQVYVSIDGGPPALYQVDQDRIDFTAVPLQGRRHTAEITVKDVNEHANRWVVPMQSGLVLTGLELDRGARVQRAAPRGPLRMEFLGDSITQGVKALCGQVGTDCDDGTKDFAYLTGRAFHARTSQVGFGRQGILVPGNGGVPTAGQSFGWNFQDSPADPRFGPDAVVVNQGTNDGVLGKEPFLPGYLSYLKQIRAAYPHAWIFAMRPFGGYKAADIATAVTQADDPRIVYVDTTGWLSVDAGDYTDGVHPGVAAHERAARLLTGVITATTGWKADPIG